MSRGQGKVFYKHGSWVTGIIKLCFHCNITRMFSFVSPCIYQINLLLAENHSLNKIIGDLSHFSYIFILRYCIVFQSNQDHLALIIFSLLSVVLIFTGTLGHIYHQTFNYKKTVFPSISNLDKL